MTDNRDARDVFDISSITDWDHVSDALHPHLWPPISLLNRLRRTAGPQAKAPLALDISQLAAKLERDTISEPPAVKPASLSPQPEVGKEHQIRCYYELIRDGGKPVCSLEALDEVYKNPAAYAEIWQPWQGDEAVSSPKDLGVFSKPLAHWKEFQKWQRDNRGLSPAAEESFTVFLEETDVSLNLLALAS
ncbi:MAG: hypothetical protein Q9211_002240 [Gyalolechia sp. 1 TL-2023]